MSLLHGVGGGTGCGRTGEEVGLEVGVGAGKEDEGSGALSSAAAGGKAARPPRRRSARMSGGDGEGQADAISYTLPSIPSSKLPDLRFISRGAYGTVYAARHADWRVPVALKCLQGPLLDR